MEKNGGIEMTDYYQIMEKMYSRKSKAYLSPYNESQEQRREELLSRESFNGKYTEQQRIDGLREIFEAHWQVTIPKTAKCNHCSKDRGVREYIDDDGDFNFAIEPCTNECERWQQKREESRVSMWSELGQKMVRKWAKLSVEQRRELLDDFERPLMKAEAISKYGIYHDDQGVWDQFGEELNEQAEEADLSYLDYTFVNWLVFDRNGEASWKAMKVMKEESK